MNMKNRTLYLGVDGGGTHCRARLEDAESNVLGEAASGCANTTSGIDNAFAAIFDATKKIFASLDLPENCFANIHAGLGLAGVMDSVEMAKAESYLHPFASLSVNSDAVAACYGAHGGADGGIAIFGTGSSGCAIMDGTMIYTGGWGFILNDFGSGAQLGLQTLRRSLLACDQIIPHTTLTRTILNHFENNPANMARWALTAKPKDFGQFAKITSKHAEDHEEDAVLLMKKSASEAEQLINSLVNQGVERMALLGGLAPHLQKHFTSQTLKLLHPPLGDAMSGAIYMAKLSHSQHEKV